MTIAAYSRYIVIPAQAGGAFQQRERVIHFHDVKKIKMGPGLRRDDAIA